MVALFLLAASRNKATVGLCPVDSGSRDVSDALQNYRQHESEMEVEDEDYGGENWNDIMEEVDFPDDDNDRANDTPRGSGKGYLRLFHGRGAILCPHLQRYLEQLERS